MKKINNNLNKAKAVKNDEFYTKIKDIKKEAAHYKENFEGKIVYCNCDDPDMSKFWIYFSENFAALKLKKLILTHYRGDENSYKVEMFPNIDGNKRNIMCTHLEGNGDFRSEECIEILKEADIVVTNPPFSLFREYISLMFEYNKKFLIIGSDNARTYRAVFKLIKKNLLWTGITKVNEFIQPDGSIKKFGNIGWFTNLPNKREDKELILNSRYEGNEENYPTYANYDAIEVSRLKEIPIDYFGAMGVPITFLDKYNPEQFKILDCIEPCIEIEEFKLKDNFKPYVSRQVTINNTLCQKTYHRIIIRKKRTLL